MTLKEGLGQALEAITDGKKEDDVKEIIRDSLISEVEEKTSLDSFEARDYFDIQQDIAAIVERGKKGKAYCDANPDDKRARCLLNRLRADYEIFTGALDYYENKIVNSVDAF